MGMYSTDVKMEFGTTLRFKKEWKCGEYLTFPKDEVVKVANYVHKYYVELHHKLVSDLVRIKIEQIDDLLEEVVAGSPCDGCIHKPKEGENFADECGECSRFYADKWERL